jgi:hypothetical protein
MNFIESECANQKAGSCIRRTDGRCTVSLGRRCGYFEVCVAPFAATRGKPRLLDDYPARTAVQDRDVRLCPGCGEPLPKRRRLCDSCAEKHRRETYRRNRDKSASDAQHLTKITH